jgi:hypothetical protein
MATINAPTVDRRQLPERRASLREAYKATFNTIDYVAMVLLIIGGLNWAMVALFDVDVVATLFGAGSAMTRLIYFVVGLAALYSIYTTAKLTSRSGH